MSRTRMHLLQIRKLRKANSQLKTALGVKNMFSASAQPKHKSAQPRVDAVLPVIVTAVKTCCQSTMTDSKKKSLVGQAAQCDLLTQSMVDILRDSIKELQTQLHESQKQRDLLSLEADQLRARLDALLKTKDAPVRAREASGRGSDDAVFGKTFSEVPRQSGVRFSKDITSLIQQADKWMKDYEAMDSHRSMETPHMFDDPDHALIRGQPLDQIDEDENYANASPDSANSHHRGDQVFPLAS